MYPKIVPEIVTETDHNGPKWITAACSTAQHSTAQHSTAVAALTTELMPTKPLRFILVPLGFATSVEYRPEKHAVSYMHS